MHRKLYRALSAQSRAALSKRARCLSDRGIIDENCVGDGTQPYSMLASSHPGESLADAIAFAGPVQVIDFSSAANFLSP
jgi:hypothetical protein